MFPSHPFLRRMVPILTILFVFLLGIVLVRWIEPRLIYFPTKASVEFHEPRLARKTVHNEFFETSDGVRLHGWWVEPEAEMPVLLVCHGNAGNISHRLDLLALLTARGLGVFLFDYRGYGKSDGSPSEEGLYRDVTAAYQHLIGGLGVKPEGVFLFGQSLGGAVALNLAVKKPCGGLILESTFTRIADMSRLMFGPIPVHWFAHSRFDSLGKIRSLGVPLLLIHGENDEVVPFEQGKRLFEAAPSPKFFHPIAGAGHNDAYLVGQEAYFDRIVAFVTTGLQTLE